MSTPEFNLASQLVHHPFLQALATNEIWAIVQGILSRTSAVLLFPEKSSLEGLVMDDHFAITHCAFVNPLNPTEVVTVNGLVGVLGRVAGSAKQLHVVSDKGKVNSKDPTQTFDVIRPLYTQFSQDGKCLQTVKVIGETELIINKRQIKVILIVSPVNFPGTPWKKTPAATEQLIDLTASLHTTATPNSTQPQPSSPAKPAKPTASRASAAPPTPTLSKVKTGTEEAAFLTRLKTAPEVQGTMADFINKFVSRPPPPAEQGAVVRGFLDELVGLIVNHRAWSSASNEELEIAAEAAEKYVMQKIYKFCFSSTTEDIARDKIIYARFQELQFITPEHLDIPVYHRDQHKLQQASEELRQINSSKTPRGKLTRILNTCKVIYSILNRASKEGHPAGADEFLPLLNYVVLKANPSQLHSNVQFILRFRATNKMITEAGYYFTHLESTITWLEKVDASKLSIDADLFQSLLRQNQEAAATKLQQQQQQKLAASGSLTASTAAPASTTSSPAATPQIDLFDLSGLSTTPIPISPSPSPSPLTQNVLNDLVWHPNSSTTTSNASSPGMTLSPSFGNISRASSGSRSATRDDDSSEASVLELLDSDSPLRFLNFNHVNELKVSELEELFQAYRMLAHENYQLRTDLYRAANKFGPTS